MKTCFWGNDFLTINILLKKTFDENFWWLTLFGEMICNYKTISTKKFLRKIFGENLFLRKWFCNHENFRLKSFDENFRCKTVFKVMILQLLKIFDQKVLIKVFEANQFSKKWFCNHKKFWTRNFWWNFLVHNCFRGNDFPTINKSSNKKLFVENFCRDQFSR